VFQKIDKKDLNWFPFNKATELKGLDEDEEEEVGRVNRIQ
jgi:inositol 1,4,5-triphosphate receptor type 1/inositol 1,4,5-triphosphate receptor type 3